jgi:hypothetical protein
MIHTKEEIKVTKIYLVSNCYGNLNKVYIGKEKSHQIKSREYSHRLIFGKQVQFDYIDQCSGWNRNDWQPLETFYIRYFRFLGFEVLNENEGGGGVEFHSEESKQKMRKPKPIGFGIGVSIRLKGKAKPKGFGAKLRKRLKGKPKKEGFGVNNSLKTKGRKDSNETIIKKGKAKIKYRKPVIQCDLEDKPIKEWLSIAEASKSLKINNGGISSCCKNKTNYAGNFKWKYK